jgi:hypothetical protein
MIVMHEGHLLGDHEDRRRRLAIGGKNVMTKETRIRLGKVGGGLVIIAGILVIIGDFAGSEHTFAAFIHALRVGGYMCLLGVLFVSQAESTERIMHLERENAALKAARGELSSSTEKT